MNISKLLPLAILASLLLSAPTSLGAEDEKLVWGENVGLVFASVDRVDNEKGLTIRADPSADGAVLGYVEKGAKIVCYNTFKNGWVKLQGPTVPTWVNLKFLKPVPFEGMVTKVDQQDLCLGIRSGPIDSSEKVGCAQIGEALKFTGVMTSDNWVQLADRRGWVTASSVEVSLSRSQPTISSPTKPSTASAESGQTEPAGKATLPAAQQAMPKPPVVEKGPVVMCSAGWCFDYEKAQVTRDGKAVSNADCFKDNVCAGIAGQHHVAKAVLDGSITFGKFKLASTGAISNLKGDQVANCAESGGISHKCVAKFLSQMIAGVAAGREDPASAKKTGASKEQVKKPTAQKTETKKQPSTKSTGSKRESTGSRSEGSRFVDEDRAEDRDEVYEKMIDEAWDDAKARGRF